MRRAGAQRGPWQAFQLLLPRGGIGNAGIVVVWACSLAGALVKGVPPASDGLLCTILGGGRGLCQVGDVGLACCTRGLGIELEAHQVQQRAQMGPGPQGWVGVAPGCGCPQGGPRIPWSAPPDSMG